MSAIKQNIRNHIKLSKYLDKVAIEVLNKKEQVNVVTYYFFKDRHLLNKKINILKTKKKYFESKYKFKAAINDILSKQKISDVAKKYNIDEQELYIEYEKFHTNRKIKRSYEYDKITDNGVFTFIEEFSLLQDLIFWKINFRNGCVCCCCALEFLLYWGYTFAITKKKKYPPTWDIYKQADEKWLYEFEMRHTREISRFFSSVCVKDTQPFVVENISKPSIYTASKEKFRPSEIYAVSIILY